MPPLGTPPRVTVSLALPFDCAQLGEAKWHLSFMRRHLLICPLLFVGFSCVSYGQLPVGFGVKGGWSLTNAYNLSSSNATGYVVGPFADLRLGFGLGVEGDALYHPVSVTDLTSSHAVWEFPIFAKYHFTLPAPLVKPFVGVGPAFRAHSGDLPNLTSKGFVMGAGVEFKLLLIRASSELRYTRWASPSVTSAATAFPDANQAEVLFGLSF